MSTQFRYKDFTFTVNPNRFSIDSGQIFKTFQPPIQAAAQQPKALTQHLGTEPMRVTGEGELIGEDRMEQYTALHQIFSESDSGLLHIPEMTPFYCYFSALSMGGKAGPQVLTYQFEFLEDCEKNQGALAAVQRYYVTKTGDTVYLIAMRFGLSAEELTAKNPQLEGLMELEAGITIWL